MWRRSFACLSGGHGDFLPNTKAGGHLDFPFVYSRKAQPAAGVGMCYKNEVHTPPPSKFSFFAPSHHVSKRVPLPHAAAAAGCQTAHAGALVCDGRTTLLPYSDYALRAHYSKSNDNAVARNNIADKAASELRAKTRDFAEHKRPMRLPPSITSQCDIIACNEYLDVRTNGLARKTMDYSVTGSVHEDVPWSPPTILANPGPSGRGRGNDGAAAKK